MIAYLGSGNLGLMLKHSVRTEDISRLSVVALTGNEKYTKAHNVRVHCKTLDDAISPRSAKEEEDRC